MSKAAAEQDQDIARLPGPQVDQLVQLLKLSSLITRPMLDGVCAPNDLSRNEVSILMCLGGEGELAGHEISDMMAIAPMNVSRALAALLERGWIEPVVDASNRRRKPMRLSERGWQAHAALMPDTARVAEELLGTISAKDRAHLSRIVGKVIDRIETWHCEHAGG